MIQLTIYRAQQRHFHGKPDHIGTQISEGGGGCVLNNLSVYPQTVHRLVRAQDEVLPFDIWEGDEFIFPNDPDLSGHTFRVVWDNFGWWFYSQTYHFGLIHLGALSTEQWQGAEKTGNYFQREMYVK